MEPRCARREARGDCCEGRVAGLRLPAPRPASPARAKVRAASNATRSQRASPVPLVQRVRLSRLRLIEGSVWLPQRVPHLARCDRSESTTTRAAGSGAAHVSPPPPPAAAGGQHTCVPPPALCIRSERVVSAIHIRRKACCRRQSLLNLSEHVG
jgi:hypothetical protein